MNMLKNLSKQASTGKTSSARSKGKTSSTDKCGFDAFCTADYIGVESPCDFKFLQTSLNLKNHGQIEKVYKIKKKIGTGTFGKVYLAKQRLTHQVRAIKQIYKSNTSVSEQRKIENEMKLLQKLSHPNILQLIEYFETDNELFLVTDVYEGGELFDEIVRRNEFTETDAGVVVQQLLSCLAYLNKKKVVHRDIKPENIMLEKSKDLTMIKLIDFGHARQYDVNRDGLMGERIGTPYYMAPEVLRKAYTEQCDVWSVGVISYILMCGFPPFNGRNNEEIFAATRSGKFSFNHEAWKHVSDLAKGFVTKILTHNPTERPNAESLLTHEFITRSAAASLEKNAVPRKDKRKSRLSRILKLKSKDEKEKSGILRLLEKTNVKRKASSGTATKDGELAMLQSFAVRNLKKFRCRQKFLQVIYTYVIAHCLPKDTRDELAKVFKAWDKDNNGVLTRDEIEEALSKHAKKFKSTIRWKSLFDMIDQDCSGFIEYHEFLVAATNPRILMTKANIESVFRIFDLDGDGFISLNELRAAIKDDNIIDDVVRDMLSEMDIDNDGRISLDEFVSMAQQF